MLGKTNAVKIYGTKAEGTIFDFKFPAFIADLPRSNNSGGSICSCLEPLADFTYEFQGYNFNNMGVTESLLTPPNI